MAAIVLSGNCRASTRTNSMTPASVVHRVWPTLFFLTFISVWSPPCQWITSAKVSSMTSMIISLTNSLMIFLRVSTDTP